MPFVERELGDFLQQESRSRGISMRRLSMNSGLSPSAVHGIFSTGRASIDSLNKLADYLGVKRQHLWQMAGLLESTDTGLTDARLMSQFERVDRLPDPARALVIRLIENAVNFVEG